MPVAIRLLMQRPFIFYIMLLPVFVGFILGIYDASSAVAAESSELFSVGSVKITSSSCDIGYYWDNEGQKCVSCGTGKTTLSAGENSKDACICDVLYMPDGDGDCIVCPEGLSCDHPLVFSATPDVMDGYTWDDEGVHECPVSEACKAGKCTKGYTGQACGDCDDGYSWMLYGYCSACDVYGSTSWIVALIICSGLMIAVHVFAAVFSTRIIPVLFIWQQSTQMVVCFGQFNVGYSERESIFFAICEAFNLDFHRFLQCKFAFGIWITGVLYLCYDVGLLISLIVFVVKLMIQNRSEPTNGSGEQEQYELRYCNLLASLEESTRSSTSTQKHRRKEGSRIEHINRTKNIIALHLFWMVMLAGAQMRWLMSVCMSSSDDVVSVYPHLVRFEGEWLDYFFVTALVAIFTFGTIIGLPIAICMCMKKMPVLDFYSIFGHVTAHCTMGSRSICCIVDLGLLFIFYCMHNVSKENTGIALVCVIMILFIRVVIGLWFSFSSSLIHSGTYVALMICNVIVLLAACCYLEDIDLMTLLVFSMIVRFGCLCIGGVCDVVGVADGLTVEQLMRFPAFEKIDLQHQLQFVAQHPLLIFLVKYENENAERVIRMVSSADKFALLKPFSHRINDRNLTYLMELLSKVKAENEVKTCIEKVLESVRVQSVLEDMASFLKRWYDDAEDKSQFERLFEKIIPSTPPESAETGNIE